MNEVEDYSDCNREKENLTKWQTWGRVTNRQKNKTKSGNYSPWKSSVLVVNIGFKIENSSKLKIFFNFQPVLKGPGKKKK